jgi:hypothetical protein
VVTFQEDNRSLDVERADGQVKYNLKGVIEKRAFRSFTGEHQKLSNTSFAMKGEIENVAQ